MTYEEAIAELNKEYLGDSENTIEAKKIGAEAIETLDRYKWHDLKNNQEDLPKDGAYCLAMFLVGSKLCIGADKYEFGIWINTVGYEVIAWKYIEPFEVEDNGNI